MPRPVHFRDPRGDPARAIRFHEARLGWKCRRLPREGHGRRRAAGRTAGGLGPKAEPRTRYFWPVVPLVVSLVDPPVDPAFAPPVFAPALVSLVPLEDVPVEPVPASSGMSSMTATSYSSATGAPAKLARTSSPTCRSLVDAFAPFFITLVRFPSFSFLSELSSVIVLLLRSYFWILPLTSVLSLGVAADALLPVPALPSLLVLLPAAVLLSVPALLPVALPSLLVPLSAAVPLLSLLMLLPVPADEESLVPAVPLCC